MRKILSIILVCVLVVTLCACSGKGSGDGATNGENITNSETGGNADNGNENSGNNAVNKIPHSGNVQSNVSGGDYSAEIITKEDPDNPTVQGVFYRNVIGANIKSDEAAVKEVDKKADAMLKKIEDMPDTIKAKAGCKTYYVAANGSNSNDGLSPSKPKETYESIVGKLNAGDAVLFRRGDIFRGQVVLKSGVSYGAYGSGIKPRFYGSIDGTQAEWKATSTKGVYEYSRVVKYANIIFDNGKAIGRPVENKSQLTKKALNVYYNGAKLQIYSPNGNPKDIYKSIEIAEEYCLFTGGGGVNNVKIQNLTLMYPGVHHLGSLGIVKNLEVEGCIMGYCGGKNLYLGSKSVSLGNCIEFWSQAVDVNIHDSYFFQAFDAALTHQGPSGTVSASNPQSCTNDFTNIHYENNLIEYCTYDIEAFTCRSVELQKKSPNGKFTYNDVYVKGNICRYTGWGWGSLDRPDKHVYATFKYDAEGENNTNIHVKPLIIENNIFDRSRKGVLGINTPESNKANMILRNNWFIQNIRANIIGGLTLKDNYEAQINKYFTASGNKFTEVK